MKKGANGWRKKLYPFGRTTAMNKCKKAGTD